MRFVKPFVSSTAAAFTLAGLFSGCFQTEPAPAPPLIEEPESQPAHWLHRAECDNIECPNPDAAAAECSNIWGTSSNKTYNIFSLCNPNGNTTNSDCYSDCFRNYCQCGSTAGTPNACPGVPAPVEPNCECHVAPGAVGHRYWCCGTESDTIHGWSDEDYCHGGSGGFGGSGGAGGVGGAGGSGGSGGTTSGSTTTGSMTGSTGSYGSSSGFGAYDTF